MFRVILDDGCLPLYVVDESDDAVWSLRVAAEMRMVHTAISPHCSCVVYVQTDSTGEWSNAVAIGMNDALVYAE
jgi:hypothetical protein